MLSPQCVIRCDYSPALIRRRDEMLFLARALWVNGRSHKTDHRSQPSVYDWTLISAESEKAAGALELPAPRLSLIQHSWPAVASDRQAAGPRLVKHVIISFFALVFFPPVSGCYWDKKKKRQEKQKRHTWFPLLNMTAKSVFSSVMRKVDKHPLYLFVFRKTDGWCVVILTLSGWSSLRRQLFVLFNKVLNLKEFHAMPFFFYFASSNGRESHQSYFYDSLRVSQMKTRRSRMCWR